MFSNLSNSIKYKISTLVLLVLAFYMLVVFFCYASFLQKDYITKATHISSKIAENIELRLQIIENTVSMAVQDYELTCDVPNYRAEFLRAFRSVLYSTTDVNSIFFYNATEEIYYDTQQKSLFNEYVEISRQKYNSNLGTSQWSLFRSTENDTVSLLYSYAICTRENIIGYMVVEVNAETFVKMIKKYNNSFTEDASIALYSSAEEYLLLYPLESGRETIRIISPEEVSEQRFVDRFVCDYPLYTKNLSVQLHILLKSVHGNALFMSVILLVILGAAGIMCYMCISGYVAYLSERLTDLTRRLDELPEKEE